MLTAWLEDCRFSLNVPGSDCKLGSFLFSEFSKKLTWPGKKISLFFLFIISLFSLFLFCPLLRCVILKIWRSCELKPLLVLILNESSVPSGTAHECQKFPGLFGDAFLVTLVSRAYFFASKPTQTSFPQTSLFPLSQRCHSAGFWIFASLAPAWLISRALSASFLFVNLIRNAWIQFLKRSKRSVWGCFHVCPLRNL